VPNVDNEFPSHSSRPSAIARIIPLHLEIPSSLRNCDLVMARSQHNVQALELFVNAESSLNREEKEKEKAEVPADYLHEATCVAALQSLKPGVVQTSQIG
jgi:hypothetical protein